MEKQYFIDRPPESQAYLRGWAAAKRHLQALFDRCNQPLADEQQGYCWLRAEIISPTFDSMNFRFRNKVFSVLVDPVAPVLVTDGEKKHHDHGYGILCRTKMVSQTTQRQRELQIEVCRDNNMIPCRFPISLEEMEPLSEGWNLRHTLTDEPVLPETLADGSRCPLSRWEYLNWGEIIVMDHLRKKGNQILSFTDMPGIQPQIWFVNDDGEPCWIQLAVNEPMEPVDFSGTMAGNYKGYMATVTILPHPGEKAVYRSEMADVEFIGMEAIGN